MNHIVCKLQENDSFSVTNSRFKVDLTEKTDYHSTIYRYFRRLYQFPKFFSNEALDLFYISLMVYYADRKVLRNKENDAWTREFKLYIPVLEYDKWLVNKSLLEEMISYLSGDFWQFEFRKRELNEKENKIAKGIEKSKKEYDTDAFCMLSGGLDSFIGAIDLLKDLKKVTFVGHYGGGKGVKIYQDLVISKLIEHYGLKKEQFFNFYAAPLGGVEDSTRTRSFMFFSHAIILASGINKPLELYIPENGFISLNIPMTNTRLGSSSTRTTHPYYMDLFQTLLQRLGLQITLINPFQFTTKGEMITNCKDYEFLKENITKTMSCSHPDQGRYQMETEPSHCGTCLPCIIRRASIEKALGTDNSIYRDKDFKLGKVRSELTSYQIGVLEFKQSFSKKSFRIQNSGIISNRFEDYNGVYERGMNELINLLDKYNG